MLDRLPPELLDHILFFAFPPAYWPDRFDNDRERRSVLWACCLVSKVVRDRAQPLLWRKIVTQSGEDLGRIERLLRLGDVGDLATQIRVLCAQKQFLPMVASVAQRSPRLIRVEVGVIQIIFSDDLAELCNSSRIESLALRNTVIRVHPTTRASCRAITSLSLSSIKTFAVSASAFLNVQLFPSLRAVAVSLVEALGQAGQHCPPPFLPPAHRHSRPFHHFLNARLVAYLLRTPLKRIRIVPHVIEDGSSFTTAVPTLLNLLTLLDNSPSKPFSVHLPYFWRDFDPALRPKVPPLVSELLDACRRNNVEVVWCREGQETESAVSEEFWEYAKRIKAERGGVQ